MTLKSDVVIVGGGLAGLTLAIQLRQALADCHVVVLERRATEPPLAAHKVGESTVEVGAHYLAETLQMRTRLEETQLRKFGLRFFFGSPAQDLADADELGASDFFPNPTWQLDRGRLERDLYTRAVEMGVEVRRGSTVTGISNLGAGERKQVCFRDEHGDQVAESDWCVDASGRAALLKRIRSMERPARHPLCAAWFRLDNVIDIDQWSSNAGWQGRCNGTGRLLSTNHLMGMGYWVWIIPLPEGRTSVGIVSDPDAVTLDSVKSFEMFHEWSKANQPLLAAALNDQAGSIMDFRFLPSLARDCKQAWSSDGWALTGESGVFADPFYSPGTDYIAIGNTFITDMIRRHGGGDEEPDRAKFYHALFRSFFASTMNLYRQQYVGFGDTRLMAAKSIWDSANYWAILAWLFFREKLTDVAFLRSCDVELQRALSLNSRMQAVFRQRASRKIVTEPGKRFIDLKAIPVLCELNGILHQAGQPPRVELGENCARLDALAAVIEKLLEADEAQGARKQCAFLGDLGHRLA